MILRAFFCAVVLFPLHLKASEVFTCVSETGKQIEFSTIHGESYLGFLGKSGKPIFVEMKRVSLRGFEGRYANETWIFKALKNSQFKFEVFRQNLLLQSIDLKCFSNPLSKPLFCESYEDFEECRDDGLVGPDGPIDDREGSGGNDNENPDDPYDGL